MTRRSVVLFLGGEERADLTPVLGRPLAAYALEASCRIGPEAVLVVPGDGSGSEDGWEGVIRRVETKTPVFLLDKAGKRGLRGQGPLGALETARNVLDKYPDRDLLIVPSCLPLVRERTLKALLRVHATKSSSLTFLSGGDEAGLTGLFVVRSADVFPLLRGLSPARGRAGFEALARRLTEAGKRVGFLSCPDPGETLPAGIGPGLSRAARLLRDRKNDALARRGVVFLDPDSAWIDWDASVGPRTVVYPFVVVEGPAKIGADGRIYPHVHIIGSIVGARVKILSSTVMEDTVLEEYDVIVIGAGPGGATCSGLLAKWGLKTLLLDKNSQIGGKAMTLSRDGFRYEMWPILACPSTHTKFEEVVEILRIEDKVEFHRPSPLSRVSYRAPSGEMRTIEMPGGGQAVDPSKLFEFFGVSEDEMPEVTRMFTDLLSMRPHDQDLLDQVSVLEFLDRYKIPRSLYAFIASFPSAK